MNVTEWIYALCPAASAGMPDLSVRSRVRKKPTGMKPDIHE